MTVSLNLPFVPCKIAPVKPSESKIYPHLSQEAKEYLKKNPFPLTYLHMIPLDDIGIPTFYPEISRKLKGQHNPNIIYPISDNLAVHIYPDPLDVRDYYIPIEPPLFADYSETLRNIESKMIDTIKETQDVKRTNEEKKELLLEKFEELVKGSNGTKKGFLDRLLKKNTGPAFSFSEEELAAIRYLIVRDKVEMGVLQPLILDSWIEDISCNGVGPIYVEHKIFGSLKTSLGFDRIEDLDRFVLQMSEKIGKPVSFRSPIVDATLPDGSRINIVFGTDVSKLGSNFTIRKFSETPLSVLELINFNTFDYMMAAYLWIMLGEGMNLFVCGETASGKTTTLNAITTFIRSNAKIVTVEDTPEVQVPHKNWIREVTRGGGEGKATVGMFDLLKAALRQRPNEIIVGEIRGEEGNIAFQAMQTGHAVMATFHAASVEKLIQRITGHPINVPKVNLDNLNVVIIQQAVRGPDGKMVRRITEISEMIGYDPYSEGVNFISAFTWDPVTDTFNFTANKNSYLLEHKIAPRKGIPPNRTRRIYKEIEKRAKILKKLAESGVTNFYDLFAMMSKLENEGVIR